MKNKNKKSDLQKEEECKKNNTTSKGTIFNYIFFNYNYQYEINKIGKVVEKSEHEIKTFEKKEDFQVLLVRIIS